MKITTHFGEDYEAKQVCVRMVKTLGVEVYFDTQSLPSKMSEKDLEEVANEDWLEAYAQILEMVSKGFPYIDLEILSTDYIEVEVVE